MFVTFLFLFLFGACTLYFAFKRLPTTSLLLANSVFKDR